MNWQTQLEGQHVWFGVCDMRRYLRANCENQVTQCPHCKLVLCKLHIDHECQPKLPGVA